MLAQVQTNEQLHFNKPFILVTSVGNNEGNDTYRNSHQKYYEHDSMAQLFKHAARINGETPVSALRVTSEVNEGGEFAAPTRADYFHNFTAALDEYRRGIRVDM